MLFSGCFLSRNFMFTLWKCLVLSSAVGHTYAQLSLPNPPILPPNASSGTQSSSDVIPNAQWSTLLGNSIYFYEAQRSGKLPQSKRPSWRNDSCLDDGQDVKLDLQGGYFDAGNFIKCTFPLSFAVMSVCWGANDFGKGYDLANQTAYLDDMLRWSLDWLMKAHPSNSTLYVQIGSGDDNYWGGDQDIPTPRPSYQINDTSPGTDAAALAAAAFASCSVLYNNRGFQSFSAPASLSNASYANTLLEHAQQLYTFAVNATGGQQTYQTDVPVIQNSYPSSGYGDDLTMAALWLSLATNSSSLYKEASNYFSQYQLQDQDAIFNWDSVTPALPILFAQISQSYPNIGGDTSQWQSQAERYFDRIVSGEGPGYKTKGGLLYYDESSDLASLNPALNAAMLMSRYAQIATNSDKKSSYQNFAQDQVDYFLGKNPMSAPYVVGSNPNSPQNPHSAMASGGNDIGDINNSPQQEAYVLYGAVVGGPDKYDKYYDLRDDWPQAEIAIDYNAPLLSLAAMHVMNDPKDPYFTSLQAGAYNKPQGTPCDPAYPCSSDLQLSKGGEIAMAVVITIVGLLLFGSLIWMFVATFRAVSTK